MPGRDWASYNIGLRITHCILIPLAIVLGNPLATISPVLPKFIRHIFLKPNERCRNWQADLQGIQNLMGALFDLNDALMVRQILLLPLLAA